MVVSTDVFVLTYLSLHTSEEEEEDQVVTLLEARRTLEFAHGMDEGIGRRT